MIYMRVAFSRFVVKISGLLAPINENIIKLSIFILALIVRLLFNVIFVGLQTIPSGDEVAYNQLAVNLVTHHEYSIQVGQPTSYRMPLFPLFLAAIYRVSNQDMFLARVILCILGSLTCIVVYLIGREVGNRRVAFIAGILASFYPLMFFWNAYLRPETLYTFFLAFACLFLLKAQTRMIFISVILGGIWLGLASLTRPTGFLIAPFIIVWAFLVWHEKPLIALKVTIVVITVMVMVMAPWIIRNYAVWHDFVPGTTQSGAALLGSYNPVIANDPENAGGWISSYKSGLVPVNADQLTELERDRLFRNIAMRWMWGHPLKTAKLALQKVIYQWWHIPNEPVERVVFLSYIVILGLAIVGLISSFKKWRNLIVFYMMLCFFTLIAIPSGGMLRYRSPVEPYLLVLAALGINRLLLKFAVTRSAISD